MAKVFPVIYRIVLVFFSLLSLSMSVNADDSLRLLRAKAIRQAAQQIAPSIVRVEKFGVAESSGEVADDAPTVAMAIDDQNHFIASSLVSRQTAASLVLVAEDGTRSTAKVIATDNHRQLVLLQSSENLGVPAVTFTDPESEVGQTVVAVGRIAGDGSIAVSSGVLSAKERLWGIALQTDARVSSVFYGGALINLKGQLLGVLIPAVPDDMGEEVTAWYDAGVAFAIPSAAIKERLPILVKGEDINSGLMGIVAKSNDPYVESTEIAAVRPRSPAARAEIQSGDIVASIDGTTVRSHREIKQLIGAKDAGQALTIELIRKDNRLTKTVTLAESIPSLRPQWIGITAEEQNAADDKEAPRVIVTGIFDDSPAAKSLQVSDALESIDGTEVASVESLRRVIFSADPDEPLKFRVLRKDAAGESSEVEVPLNSSEVATALPESLPGSLLYTAEAETKWKVAELSLPDIANKGFIAAPDLVNEEAAGGPELGLLLLLANPGDADLEKQASGWLDSAKKLGVMVCVLSPANAERWQPDEIDAAGRVVASISKRYPVSEVMTAVGGVSVGAGSSMAMAVAIGRPGKFAGLAVSPDVTPPAIRLRENEASAPLQLLLRGATNPDEPSWATALEKAGYAVLRGNDDNETLLRWVRSMSRI